MGIIYGSNEALETARTVVNTALTALVTAMSADSPKVSHVYTTHWGTAALQFNSVSIGISAVEVSPIAQSATNPSGPLDDMMFNVELRVMTGFRNTYLDEIKVMRLCNSIVNYFETHRSLGSGFWVTGDYRIEVPERFDDTDTVGGLINFTIRTSEAYVAA